MDWFARDFIKSSLAWLGVGVTFGVFMAIRPAFSIYAPAHMHINLLGFVTMMIYGVGYHVLPRFAGAKLWSRKLPAWHFWASNVGLAGMVAGLVLRVHVSSVTAGSILLAIGGTLSAFGAYAFVFNLWKSMNNSRTTPPIGVQTRRPN